MTERRKLERVAELAVRLGLQPREMAEEFDRWAEDMAFMVERGLVSEEFAHNATLDRAGLDAQRARALGYPRGCARLWFGTTSRIRTLLGWFWRPACDPSARDRD